LSELKTFDEFVSFLGDAIDRPELSERKVEPWETFGTLSIDSFETLCIFLSIESLMAEFYIPNEGVAGADFTVGELYHFYASSFERGPFSG